MMNSKVTEYIAKLELLKPDQLMLSAEAVVRKEKCFLGALIAHLAIIQERRLYLEAGFRSMFEYGEQCLKLDPGCIWARLQVASACRKFPILLTALMNQKISLTSAAKLAPHLTEENAASLIENSQNLTVKQIEDLLNPVPLKTSAVSSIRKTAVPMKTVSQPVLDIFCATSSVDGVLPAPVEFVAAPIENPTYLIKFSASGEFKDKLQRLAQLLGHECADKVLEEVLTVAVDTCLERKDPEKQEARAKRKTEVVLAKTDTRYIARSIYRAVLKRAGYQCEHRSHNGRRCSAKAKLQIDHIKPFARGGRTELDNLQALCAQHNLLKAKKDFGLEFLEKKIAKARPVIQSDPCEPASKAKGSHPNSSEPQEKISGVLPRHTIQLYGILE